MTDTRIVEMPYYSVLSMIGYHAAAGHVLLVFHRSVLDFGCSGMSTKKKRSNVLYLLIPSPKYTPFLYRTYVGTAPGQKVPEKLMLARIYVLLSSIIFFCPI